MKIFERFRRGLIVSCQAASGSPFFGPSMMARMARCALAGGAKALRVNGSADIAAIKLEVALPVIGINKVHLSTTEIIITPTFAAAREVSEAGAEIIAIDATDRGRPPGEDLATVIRRIHDELRRPVLADVSTTDEGVRAELLGADAVATTLSGYTPYSRAMTEGEPDLQILRELAGKIRIPLICEGRVSTPAQARAALEAGAFAVVVGTALTAPDLMTSRFVKFMA